MGAVPKGKGAFLSSPYQFKTDELLKICEEANLKYLLFATHFEGAERIPPLQKQGIQCWAYDWADPSTKDTFISRSIKWIDDSGAWGLVVDAEGPYQNKPQEAAELASDVLKETNYGINMGIGFTSMGAAYFHPNLPWKQFSGLGFGMPQTYHYAANTPGAAAKSVQSWVDKGFRYIVPVVPVWREDDKPLTSEALVKLMDDLKAAGANGVAAWSLIHKSKNEDLWKTFADYEW